MSDKKFLEFYARTLLKHVQENKIRENFDKIVAACGHLSDTHGEPYIDAVGPARRPARRWAAG